MDLAPVIATSFMCYKFFSTFLRFERGVPDPSLGPMSLTDFSVFYNNLGQMKEMWRNPPHINVIDENEIKLF